MNSEHKVKVPTERVKIGKMCGFIKKRYIPDFFTRIPSISTSD
jgi:hypothetical protein